ncbi:glyoxalase/bleomycin resistance protein/dioxygenase superfamily protein [Actinomadura sp. NBRC 104412]|uniref:VOC family protein n=1 Tax=Actinomadura sp. NBRC 104412 TaxID=3032203 RepID=UPI0024A2BA87|nr:VOC family protein [Actinomadura sp. NBRC 104412]GLZ06124.1 glyoxalase/bleomycin resistance protein/dioxygenase superfamily protein [Actinomadura sp. NBRC 104412]
MGIQRIESVVYSVEDLAECVRFFSDLGLALVTRTDDQAVFETIVKQTVRLHASPIAGAPPALEPGPTIREVVWGVDTPEALSDLVDALAKDREVVGDEGGVYHTIDETGFGLGLTLAGPSVAEVVTPREANVLGHVRRWNAPVTSAGRVRPLRMCHLALNIPKAGRDEAVALYTDRLGFVPTDIVRPMGVFMRCEGDADHHNFLLCHRPDRAGVNHVAFEVPGFDEVIEGGNHMVGQGWREARRLGRHTIGSNVFRFVHAPCGGRVELAADMDRVDGTYGTRVHETAPPHHIWTLRTSGDPKDDQ